MTVVEKKEREQVLWDKAVDALISGARFDVIKALLSVSPQFARRREFWGKEFLCIAEADEGGTVYENRGTGEDIALEEIGWERFYAEVNDSFQLQKKQSS